MTVQVRIRENIDRLIGEINVVIFEHHFFDNGITMITYLFMVVFHMIN